MSLHLIKVRLNFSSNFLDQNNLKSKYKWKNELIYIRDFEAIQKTRSLVSSGLKTRGNLSASPRVFKPDNTLLLVFWKVLNYCTQIKKAVEPVGLG